MARSPATRIAQGDRTARKMSERHESKRSYGGLVLVGIGFIALAVFSALSPDEEIKNWEHLVHPDAVELKEFDHPAFQGGLYSVTTNFSTVRDYHIDRFELVSSGSPQFRSRYGLFGHSGSGLADTHQPDPFGSTILVQKDGERPAFVVVTAAKSATNVFTLIAEPKYGTGGRAPVSMPLGFNHYPSMKSGSSGGGAGSMRIESFSSSDEFETILDHYETELGIDRTTIDGKTSFTYRSPDALVLPAVDAPGLRVESLGVAYEHVAHLIHLCQAEGEAETQIIFATIFD